MFITIASPGKDGDAFKNQDWGSHCCKDGVYTAAVCDGTTASPRAEYAARYVASCAKAIFQHNDALSQIVNTLRSHRTKLLAREIKLSPAQQRSRSIFEEIVTEKRKISYQTTLVAGQWQENPDATLSLRWMGCGDSAIFVFGADGALRLNNLDLADEYDPFKHASPITQVIPDNYKDEQHFVSSLGPLPADSAILLCSDGFYDCFNTLAEIYEWTCDNWQSLQTAEELKKIQHDLHQRLRSKKGDDDIYALYWFAPSFRMRLSADRKGLVP